MGEKSNWFLLVYSMQFQQGSLNTFDDKMSTSANSSEMVHHIVSKAEAMIHQFYAISYILNKTLVKLNETNCELSLQNTLSSISKIVSEEYKFLLVSKLEKIKIDVGHSTPGDDYQALSNDMEPGHYGSSPCGIASSRFWWKKKYPEFLILNYPVALVRSPPHLHSIPGDSLYFIFFRVKVHSAFMLLFFFREFIFAAQLWCFFEFLSITNDFPFENPNYFFCGRKHPFELFHKNFQADINIFGKNATRFLFYYHIMSSDSVQEFEICQHENCLHRQCNDGHCTSSTKLHKMVFSQEEFGLTPMNKIQWVKSDSISIFNIAVEKFKLLRLNVTSDKVAVVVFDGPGPQSQKMSIPHNKLFRMSSFQATIAVYNLHLISSCDHRSKMIFISTEVKREIEHLDAMTNLTLQYSSKSKKKVIYHVTWLLKPDNISWSIVVDEVNYTGPEESKEFICYGGIAVYFLDTNDNNTEILHISHTMSRNSTDKKRNRRKEYFVVTETDTTFVVFVFYVFKLFSALSARLLVTKTSCVGSYIKIENCSLDVYTISAPNNTEAHCMIFTIYNTLQSDKHFKSGMGMEKMCPVKLDIIIQSFHLHSAMKEYQILSHMFTFSLEDMEAEIFLYDMVNVYRYKERKHFYSMHRFPYPEPSFSKQSSEENAFTIFEHLVLFAAFCHGRISTLAFLAMPDFLPDAWASISINIQPCSQLPCFLYSLFPGVPFFVPFFDEKWSHQILCERVINEIDLKNLHKKFQQIVHSVSYNFLTGKPFCAECFLSFHLAKPIADRIYLMHHPENQSERQVGSEQKAIFRQSTNFYPQLFSFTVPNTEIVIPIPVANYPRCFYCVGYSFSSLCPFFQVLLPNKSDDDSHGTNTFFTEAYTPPDISHDLPSFLELRHQCEEHEYLTCITTRLSWTEANENCASKGFTLPSVHSAEDMHMIFHSVHRTETLLSKYQSFGATCTHSDERHIWDPRYVESEQYLIDQTGQVPLEIQYQTAAIYIGLRKQVRKHSFQLYSSSRQGILMSSVLTRVTL